MRIQTPINNESIMKKIKVFTCSQELLQERIDNWIKKEQPMDIISVTPAILGSGPYTHVVATILYVPSENIDF